MIATNHDWRTSCVVRIAARVHELHALGAIANVGKMRSVAGTSCLSLPLRELIRWSLYLQRAHQLFDDVVPAAGREPGRVFVRETWLQHGTPKGTIQWPKTLARRSALQETSELEFVCTGADRLITAPENILLVLTIEDVALSDGGIVHQIEQSGLLPARGGDVVRTFREAAQIALNQRAMRACRAAARQTRRKGHAEIAKLELAVARRVRNRPASAPIWAKTLLELRRELRFIPGRLLTSVWDRQRLWQALAEVEMLSGVRSVWPVRQRDEHYGSFGHHTLRMVRSAEQTHWLLVEDGNPCAAIALSGLASVDAIRLDAYERERLHALEVQRWIVLHEINADIPEIRSKLDAHAEIQFVTVSVEVPAVRRIGAILGSWLPAASSANLVR